MWMVLNSDHTSLHQDWPDPRHPVDKLVDNPTVVVCCCCFFFFLDFFFKQKRKGFVQRSEYKASSRHHGTTQNNSFYGLCSIKTWCFLQ